MRPFDGLADDRAITTESGCNVGDYWRVIAEFLTSVIVPTLLYVEGYRGEHMVESLAPPARVLHIEFTVAVFSPEHVHHPEMAKPLQDV